jgi:hypothetical protein
MLERGKIVAELVIFIFKNAALDILKTKRYTSSADSIIVMCGIWIGQAEGKPMTAAKLAQFIGMPRATVIRKVNDLLKLGIVSEVGNGLLMVRLDSAELVAIHKAGISANAKHIHSASRRLSKLDG